MDGGSSLPGDLVPLPTSPWDQRPTELPLDVEECRTALWRCRGNITEAAKLLKIESGRLRRFIDKSPYLTEERQEALEQLVDIAEDNVYDALTDTTDPGRKDSMTRYVLTARGGDRGWGSASKGSKVNINLPKGSFQISWEDGSSISGNSNDPETIDVTPNRAAE